MCTGFASMGGCAPCVLGALGPEEGVGFLLSAQRFLCSQMALGKPRMLNIQGCCLQGKDVGPAFCPEDWEWWLITWVILVLSVGAGHTKLPQAGPEEANYLGSCCIIYMARGSPNPLQSGPEIFF
jgi:hypothetical protein